MLLRLGRILAGFAGLVVDLGEKMLIGLGGVGQIGHGILRRTGDELQRLGKILREERRQLLQRRMISPAAFRSSEKSSAAERFQKTTS